MSQLPYTGESQRDEHDNSGGVDTKRVSLYGWNTSTLRKVRAEITEDGAFVTSPSPTPTTGVSFSLDYNAAGDLITVRKIIGATTYTRTISNDDTSVADTKTISVWS